jgi:hypothetical protein
MSLDQLRRLGHSTRLGRRNVYDIYPGWYEIVKGK